MRKQYFSFIFLYIFSSCLYSQTMDDNIIINCCEDSYVSKKDQETTPSYKTPERPNMKPCGWELPYNLICSMANSSP